MKPYKFKISYNGKKIATKTVLAYDVNHAWMQILEMYEEDCNFELVK